ncbi:hypothetical protein ACWIG5_32410 [Streptomyces lydicus]
MPSPFLLYPTGPTAAQSPCAGIRPFSGHFPALEPEPPDELPPWKAATLIRSLVHRSDGGPMRPVADALANGLIALLGPDADWRANGHAAYREERQRRYSWASVTEATFDAAVGESARS